MVDVLKILTYVLCCQFKYTAFVSDASEQYVIYFIHVGSEHVKTNMWNDYYDTASTNFALKVRRLFDLN